MKVSNSLIGTVDLILSKELSFDDIDKIYSLESYTKEDIPFIIDTYGNLWSAITKRINRQVCDKYGVEKLSDINDNKKRGKAQEEINLLMQENRRAEIRGNINDEAREILELLFNSKKIVQIGYGIPKGQTVKVLSFDGGKEEDKPIVLERPIIKEMTSSGENTGVLLNINGIIYYYPKPFVPSLSLGYDHTFESDLALMVNQVCLGHGYYSLLSRANQMTETEKKHRLFFLGEIFPQFKKHIKIISEYLSLNIPPKEKLTETQILQVLGRRLNTASVKDTSGKGNNIIRQSTGASKTK